MAHKKGPGSRNGRLEAKRLGVKIGRSDRQDGDDHRAPAWHEVSASPEQVSETRSSAPATAPPSSSLRESAISVARRSRRRPYLAGSHVLRLAHIQVEAGRGGDGGLSSAARRPEGRA